MASEILSSSWLRVGALVLCVGTALPASAQRQTPVLGGPSVIKVTEAATVSGSGLPANSAVTVVVVAPSGAKASFGAVTDDQGRVSHRLAANATGRWEVAVQDSGGQQLAKTAINFLP